MNKECINHKINTSTLCSYVICTKLDLHVDKICENICNRHKIVKFNQQCPSKDPKRTDAHNDGNVPVKTSETRQYKRPQKVQNRNLYEKMGRSLKTKKW